MFQVSPFKFQRPLSASLATDWKPSHARSEEALNVWPINRDSDTRIVKQVQGKEGQRQSEFANLATPVSTPHVTLHYRARLTLLPYQPIHTLDPLRYTVSSIMAWQQNLMTRSKSH